MDWHSERDRASGGVDMFPLDVSGTWLDSGKSSEVSQIHRTRWPDRQYREELYPKHCAEELARPFVCLHVASRTLPRRASSKCRTSASRAASVYLRPHTKKTRRRGSIHELSTGVAGPDPQPGESSRRSAMVRFC